MPRSFLEHGELDELLQLAELPRAASVRVLADRGFDNIVRRVELADGRIVVSRTDRQFGEVAIRRNCLLIERGVPTPVALAATEPSALFDCAPGTLLGDLIDTDTSSAAAWRAVGAAYRQVHAIDADVDVITAVGVDAVTMDPVARAHADVAAASRGVERRLPDAIHRLGALHELIDTAAPSLRCAPLRLLHGDVNMWNVLVDDQAACIIDWDDPAIGDPAREIALLDKHASLFIGVGLDAAFFHGYGQSAIEPNTSLYRLILTLSWAASSDWDNWDRQRLPNELRRRTAGWLQTLLAYLADIELHLERTHQLCRP